MVLNETLNVIMKFFLFSVFAPFYLNIVNVGLIFALYHPITTPTR